MAGEDGSNGKEEAMDGGDSSKQAMRWESILPRRSLRVLLVESDDATRHIVTALLRKCNYRVAGVADGMKAWEVMKEKKYIFDLVLTEVAMPTLSGIGLLTKIMGAEECKNIPVIMMSTHDSVNVVLNCMLKGAVDFLVKPVRKNELRNLWQHVWRRHCVSNSSLNASDNTTASNQISVNVGETSKSDENSDAQSSDNKQDVNNESMQNPDQPSQSEGRHMDKVEASPISDKDLILEKCASKKVNDQSVANVSEQSQPHNISYCRETSIDLMREIDGTHDPRLCIDNNTPNPDSSVPKMIVFVEPQSDRQCTFSVLKNDALEDTFLGTAKSSFANNESNIVTAPVLELSLKRPQFDGCGQIELKERNVIKPSVASAFSRETSIDLMREIDGTYDPILCIDNNTPNPDSSVPKMIVFVEPHSDRQCTFSVLKNDALEDTFLGTANSSFANNENIVTAPVLELSLKIPQFDGCGQIELKERNVIKPHNISYCRETSIDLMREIDGTHDPRLCIDNNTTNPDSSVPKMIVFVEPQSDRQCTFSVLKNDALEDTFFGTANSSFANNESNIVTAPVLELSLKIPQFDGCGQIELKERNVIKPSVASAFSRYDDKRAQPSTGHVEMLSNSEKNTSITYTDKRIMSSPQRNGVEATIYFQVSSTNNEKSSLPPQPIRNTDTNTINYPQFGFLPIPFGTLPYHNLCQGYGALMQPMFFPEQISSKHAIDISEPSDSRELCYINEKTYNNGSCSHDFFKFNGSNDSGKIEDRTRNIGVSIEGANESSIQKLDRSRREAALLKFRLKRKDRCFEKKVRYHSRQQLAEQRPRIKGQFVRQKVETTTAREANS